MDVCTRRLVSWLIAASALAGCGQQAQPPATVASGSKSPPALAAADATPPCNCTAEEQQRCAALGQVCSATGSGGQCQKSCVDASQARPLTGTQGEVSGQTARTASKSEEQGPGMRVTFQSCGYQATGLKVGCRNGNTGGLDEQLLFVTDTSPESCALRLVTACTAVGYRAQQQGASTVIFGTGITVAAVGPLFTKVDF